MRVYGADTDYAQAALFVQATELQNHNPDSLLIGSVARAAIMGTPLSLHRPSGVMRDIDLVRMSGRNEPVRSNARNVDTLFEHWIAEDGSYLVFPHDPRICVPVAHPEVFYPHTYEVAGGHIVTPHPDVLGKISTMMFVQRPKDTYAARLYSHFLEVQSEHLPEELLRPFDILRNILSKQRSYRVEGQIRNAYHVVVPEPIRGQLQLGEKFRWLRAR